jgi:uncharacterized membrane protein
MSDWTLAHEWADLVAHLIELAGVGVIALGAVVSAVAALVQLLGRRPWPDVYTDLRANLGRFILLGLELLVGADIISTITAPLTFQSVGLLAAIVGIRTFLSFSLETEIEGRWPWRRGSEGSSRAAHPD